MQAVVVSESSTTQCVGQTVWCITPLAMLAAPPLTTPNSQRANRYRSHFAHRGNYTIFLDRLGNSRKPELLQGMALWYTYVSDKLKSFLLQKWWNLTVLKYWVILQLFQTQEQKNAQSSVAHFHWYILEKKAEFCSRATYCSAKSSFYWQRCKKNIANMKLYTMFRIISYLRRDLKENNCILITWLDTRLYILHNIFINDYSDFYDRNSLLSSQIHWCPRDVVCVLSAVK